VCRRRHSASAHHQFGGEHISFEGLNAGSQLLEQSLGTDTAELGDWLFNRSQVKQLRNVMAINPNDGYVAARAKSVSL
jgi:hypothetical protein